MLGEVTTKLPPMVYRELFKYQVRASQAILVSALVLLAAGPALSAIYVGVHGRFMLTGLVLFYLSVMYSQHPGFTRFMPSRPVSTLVAGLSIAWAVLYLMEAWPWKILLAVWVTLYIALLIRHGLGRIPLFYPNTFTLLGLVSLYVAIFSNSPFSLIGFPMASLTSLMRRVEDRRRFNVLDIPYFTLPILAFMVNNRLGLTMLVLFELLALSMPSSLPRMSGLSAVYLPGSVLGRFGLAIAIAVSLCMPQINVVHMVLVGFIAVMMTSLCIPMLIPGYLWIWPRGYGFETPLLVEMSALARLLYPYGGATALYASLVFLYTAIADIMVHYALGKRIPVEV